MKCTRFVCFQPTISNIVSQLFYNFRMANVLRGCLIILPSRTTPSKKMLLQLNQPLSIRMLINILERAKSIFMKMMNLKPCHIQKIPLFLLPEETYPPQQISLAIWVLWWVMHIYFKVRFWKYIYFDNTLLSLQIKISSAVVDGNFLWHLLKGAKANFQDV